MFKHKKLSVDLPELSIQYKWAKRFYETPGGNLVPSVTTVLSLLDREAIDAWRARVGKEEADRIAVYCRNRGNVFHEIAEQYLNNELDESEIIMPMFKELFGLLKKELDSHVDDIQATEMCMWSDRLGLAGTTDCIGNYDSKLSVIDFKTSFRAKKEEWIAKYFAQCWAYACMFQERTGVQINQVVIFIACDDGTMQTFIQNSMDLKRKYVKLIIETTAKFNEEIKELESQVKIGELN